MSLEDFGADLEDFGAEPTAPEESPAELQAMIDDLNKQIASTMDEILQQKLRNAKRVIQEKLGIVPAKNTTNKTDGQWADMAKAYGEFYGAKANPWKEKLAAYGGVCDEAYEKLRHELAEANTAKDAAKPRAGRKGGVEKAKVGLPPPEERFAAAMQHATNLGLDGQVIFDELGVGHDAAGMDALVAAINARAGAAPSVSVPESAGSGDATLVPEAEGQAINYFDDTKIQGLINSETGEVSGRDWLLDKLGWTQYPTEPSKEYADRIVDVLLTTYIEPAKRYRSQAELRAVPLDQRAKQIIQLFEPYLAACSAKFLPTHKADSKVDAKSQHKAGDFKEKTLKLNSGCISWTKDGGLSLTEPAAFYVWLAEKKTEMLALCDQGTPESAEELALLEKKYGFQLKTELAFDKDKVAKELAPGYKDVAVNEFTRCTIK